MYYKAFKRDKTCRGMVYEEGQTYEISERPKICERGFHFCQHLVLTLEYYPVTKCITENLYAEVEAIGEIDWELPNRHKGCTNKIKIVRFLTDKEVKDIVDGKNNSGDRNSGDSNSGDSNSGHRNSGDSNSGDSNSGHRNSGDSNSGHWNSGDRNSGHWNSCNNESGFFNSKQQKYVNVFNKKCLLSVWEKAKKPDFLFFEIDKELGYKGSFQKSFEKASKEDIELLKSLPNFNKKVFFEISGIKIK